MNFFKKILFGIDPEQAAKHIAEGVQKAKLGRFKDAEALYLEAQKRDPDNAIATLNLAIVRMDMFNARAAKLSAEDQATRLADIYDLLEEALEKDRTLVAGHRLLGHVARRLSRYLRAERAFTDALDLAARDYPHTNEINLALMQVKPLADRVRHVEKLAEIADDPGATDEDVKAALDAFVVLLPAPGEETDDGMGIDASRLLLAARLARRTDDDDRATDLLLRVLEADAHNLSAKRELATLCMKNGDRERALTFSLAAYQEDPTDAGLVCNVGVCFLELGKLDEAREYIALAKGLAPDDPIVQNAEETLQEKTAPSAAG